MKKKITESKFILCDIVNKLGDLNYQKQEYDKAYKYWTIERLL